MCLGAVCRIVLQVTLTRFVLRRCERSPSVHSSTQINHFLLTDIVSDSSPLTEIVPDSSPLTDIVPDSTPARLR